ncbi:hypothetical protein ACFX14_033426 [Malus domestica]
MHMQLLRTNKVIMSDRTDHGPCCIISLPSSQCCRDPSDTVLKKCHRRHRAQLTLNRLPIPAGQSGIFHKDRVR